MKTILPMLCLLAAATPAYAVPSAAEYQAEMDRMAALIALLPADAAQLLVADYAECLTVNPVEWSVCDHLMDEAAAKAGIAGAN